MNDQTNIKFSLHLLVNEMFGRKSSGNMTFYLHATG